jgi:uncharacterized GH25 family protein
MRKSIKIIFSLLLLTSVLFAFNSTTFLPTSLKITVLNELGNPVEGAKVQLYTSDEDYRAEENLVGKAQLTDKKGKTTFKKLEVIPYFVNVEKGDKNNDGAGVQTDTLKTGFLNKVTIIIE